MMRLGFGIEAQVAYLCGAVEDVEEAVVNLVYALQR